jgi:DNA-directed RNA polymerase subunit RPC12/RpoP
MKCGANLGASKQSGQTTSVTSAPRAPVIAPMGVTSLKCPNCGAPISPKFGEMVITCEYCGSAVTLSADGWSSVQKQTMLPLKFADKDQMTQKIHDLMDKGFMHRHLQESSTLQDLNLSFVPYWIIPVSARTTVVASNETMQLANTAASAALFGVVLGGLSGGGGGGGGGYRGGRGGGRRIFVPSFKLNLSGTLGTAKLGMFMGGGMMGGGGMKKTAQIDNNYSFPVVALKALTQYQPKNYLFSTTEKTLFDVSKIPKGIPVLNGDIGEEDAKNQAKTYVDQLQSDKAHSQYHMIQSLHTDIDVSDGELLHAPIWFAKYDHKGSPIVLVIDGNSGFPMTTMGLD